MLIKFKTKNFKSFSDLATLDLTKGKTRKHEDRIAHLKNIDVLKFTSIFGSNASGKSNLIHALKIMQHIVIFGTLPLDAINEYYKLDDKLKEKPTYFETIISIKGKVFSYGLEINLSNGIINSEWLIELQKKNDGTTKEKNIFVRENNVIEYSSSLQKNGGIMALRLKVYVDDVKNNPRLLLLNIIGLNTVTKNIDNDVVIDILNVFLWFRQSLKVVYPDMPFITPEIIYSSIDKLNEILIAFDTGIRKIEKVPINENDFYQENAKNGIDLLATRQLINITFANNDNIKVLFRLPSGLWLIERKGVNFLYFRMGFLHDNNKNHLFNSTNESDGTMRLFELAEPLAPINNDSVFVIDELDRCLHPRLTIQYINTFLEKAKSPNNNNQLIVTTHESRLLNLDYVRRDEIWFVEKENNMSKLYSLEEFNVRFDNVIDKAYMEGRFGGVPIFDKLYLSNLVKDENKKY